MPPAFLAVLSEPGPLISLPEFHDWYDSEHIPLRMNHLPSFLSAARFSATDSLHPSWLALYDIDDTSTFQDVSYTQLRTNRSEREAGLVKRMQVLDRRCCEVVWDSGAVAESVSTSLGVGNPAKVVVTHGLEQLEAKADAEADDAEVNAVQGMVSDRLRGEPDWVRTRLFKCIDTLKTGISVSSEPEAQKVPPFLVLHGKSPPASDEL